MLETLLERFIRHDRRALTRLLTLAARGEAVSTIRAAIPHRQGKARIVAITGSAGVGKSTMVGRLVELLRERHLTVAVLACDPQSSLTGGALLGDRARMPGHPDDDGVLIRSLAVESGEQAIARRLGLMLDLLEAFGFDVILIETVGAGQGDTAVGDEANVVILLVQPESGDELQWEKAGLLEVADLVVVHKSDLPGSERAVAQLQQLLNLPGCREVPVLRASAGQGQGIVELWTAVESQSKGRPERPHHAAALLRLVQQQLAERFDKNSDRITAITEDWKCGKLSDGGAVQAVLELLGKS